MIIYYAYFHPTGINVDWLNWTKSSKRHSNVQRVGDGAVGNAVEEVFDEEQGEINRFYWILKSGRA